MINRMVRVNNQNMKKYSIDLTCPKMDVVASRKLPEGPYECIYRYCQVSDSRSRLTLAISYLLTFVLNILYVIRILMVIDLILCNNSLVPLTTKYLPNSVLFIENKLIEFIT